MPGERAARFGVGRQAHCAVGCSSRVVGRVESGSELGTTVRISARDIRQAGERTEREQVRLRTITHGRVTIATRNLLTLDRAVNATWAGVRRFGASGSGVQ